jgi:hypothetical protein
MIEKPRGRFTGRACGALVAVAALAGGLAACGGSSASGTTTATTDYIDSPVTWAPS